MLDYSSLAGTITPQRGVCWKRSRQVLFSPQHHRCARFGQRRSNSFLCWKKQQTLPMSLPSNIPSIYYTPNLREMQHYCIMRICANFFVSISTLVTQSTNCPETAPCRPLADRLSRLICTLGCCAVYHIYTLRILAAACSLLSYLHKKSC